MKVYELAKDLNIKSVQLLDRLKKEPGLSVKNHMQNLNEQDVQKIRSFFETPKLETTEPKKKPPKKKPVLKKKAGTHSLEQAEEQEKPALRVGVIRRRSARASQSKSEKASSDGADSSKKTSDPLSQKAKTPPKTAGDTQQESSKEGAGQTPASGFANRHIRPGLVSDDQSKSMDMVDLVEAEKKKAKKSALEKESQGQQFRATDFRKREVIFQPKKKKPTSSLSTRKTQITTPKSYKRLIKMYDNNISLEDLSHQMGMKKRSVIQKIKTEKLLESADKNSVFDYETAEALAHSFGFEVKNMMKSKEELISSLFFGDLKAEKQNKAPVVTVMGHVNHGKTSLLDYIRKSRVATQEAGGITQHIGAYSVPVGKSFVTFIDTPGHSAFANMRARGAKVTDIVVLVVAVDDGVQAQTIEAIQHAKAAKAPVIVALNKVDLESANIEQTKKQLMEQDLVPEEWGGDTVFCSISAKKGEGIANLLEHIQLLAEVSELKANPKRSAVGVIIESRTEKGRGCVMSLLVQDGTLKAGDVIIADNQMGRARQMTNDMGQAVSLAVPGRAVEISGFSGEPARVGGLFYAIRDEKSGRRFLAEQEQRQGRLKEAEPEKPLSLDELLLKTYNKNKTLKLILKADVAGSLEAIKYSIEELNTKEVKAQIIHASVGAVTENDALLASTTSATIFCFNSKVSAKARKWIQEKSILVHAYTVIYDLLKEVEAMMAGLLDPEIQETFGGRALVQQIFPVSSVGTVAGCKVSKGKIASHHLARLIRENNVIYQGKISSLKRFKQSVKEALEGQECGVGLNLLKDIREGDIIESFTQKAIKRESLKDIRYTESKDKVKP